MAIVLKDRVKQSAAAPGTGTITLGATPVGFQAFSAIGNGNVTYFAIVDPISGDWEVNYGTYTLSGTTLSRNATPLSSSAAGALVNFTGAVDVFCTYPSEKAIYEETGGNVLIDGGPITVIGNNVTTYTTFSAALGEMYANINSFAQFYAQNLSDGTEASADFVAYNDLGDGNTNFVDMGINSSNYTSTTYPIFTPGSAYVFNDGGEMIIGSATDDLLLFAGGVATTNWALRADKTTQALTTKSDLNVGGDLDVTGAATFGSTVLLNADPTLALQAATKQYVDQAVSTGLHLHQPVRVATTANLTATYNNGSSGVGATLTNSGTQVALSIDGISLSTTNRVLVWQQSAPAQNGVYVVTTVGSGSTNWVLTRSSDTDTYVAESDTGLGGGDYFYVQEGLTGAGDSYVCTNTGSITFGTTAITFAQFSGAITYTGGTNIDVTGQVISLTGTVAPTNGGTGVNTVTTGDLLYGSATNTWGKLAAGSAYKSLVMNAGGTQVEWNAVALNQSGAVSGALPATNGGTGLSSYTLGDTVYASAANTLSALAGNTTTTKKFLVQTGTGSASAAPVWGTINGADVSGNISGSAGSVANALTFGTYLTGGTYNGSAAVTATVDATSANTASKVVARDSSGNFSAGTITATLSGSATSATTATNLAGGAANQLAYQSGSGTTSFATAPTTSSTYLYWNGSAFAWGAITSGTVTSITAGAYLTGGTITTSGTIAVDATSANTASKVVARDASGNFSAGTITATLSGNATSSTTTAQTNFSNLTIGGSQVLYAGNYSSYALPLSGGTLSGTSAQMLTVRNTAEYARLSLDGASGSGGDLIFKSNGVSKFGIYNINGGGDLGFYPNDGGTASVVMPNAGGLLVGGSTVLTAGNYNSYTPTLTGTGAYGTWGINISGSSGSTSGNAATATNISNTGTVTLATATEANSIYVTAPSYTTDSPVKLLNFDWYSNVWSISNIRSGATPSNGFGFYYTPSGGSRTEVMRMYTGNYVQAVNSFRAPIFYDSDNTGYYVDPANTSNFSLVNVNNYIQTNSGGVKWDQSGVRSWSMYPTGGYMLLTSGDTAGYLLATLTGGVRSPIFYDSDNTAYYCDPNSVSRLETVRATGLQFGGSDAYAFYSNAWAGTGGYPGYQYTGGSSRFGFSSTSGAIDVYTDGNFYGGVDYYGANKLVPLFDANQGGGALYGSIFYDTNNTGYYCDPSGTSNFAGLTVANSISGYVDGASFNNDSENAGNITNRITTGFWQNSAGTTATGWPVNSGSWQHLISCTHSNDGNYFALQLAATFFNQGLYYRSVNNNGAGGWYRMTMYGDNYGSSLYATIYYDADNTGYYVDPASTSNLYTGIFNSGATFYSDGSSRAMYIRGSGNIIQFCDTDGTFRWENVGRNGQYYVYKGYGTGAGYKFQIDDSGNITLNNGSNTTVSGNFYAPIFYDSNDTGYYVDPNSNSKLYYLQLLGSSAFDGLTSLNVTNNTTSYGRAQVIITGRLDNGNDGWSLNGRNAILFNINNGGSQGAIGTTNFSLQYNLVSGQFGVMSSGGASPAIYWSNANSNTYLNGGLYAPIFYDIDNTGYYLNPNGVSVLGGVNSLPLQVYKSSGVNSACTMFVNTNGDNSWGIVSEFRVEGTGDKPSILFSNAVNTQTWSIGYGYTDTTYFRINRDHGWRNQDWGVTLMQMDRSGNVTFTGNVTAYSDERIKTNIKKIDHALDMVRRLNGVTFNYIEDGREGLGVIAQNVEEVLPMLVSEMPSSNGQVYKNVAYGNMVGVLIEATKEQDQEVVDLRARVAKLEALISKLITG